MKTEKIDLNEKKKFTGENARKKVEDFFLKQRM
jgi:hypothetical protein